jgi:hypothetical protein
LSEINIRPPAYVDNSYQLLVKINRSIINGVGNGIIIRGIE